MLCTTFASIFLFISIDSTAFVEGREILIVSEKTLPDGKEELEYSFETSSAIDEAIEKDKETASIMRAKAHAELVAGHKKEEAEMIEKELKARILARAEQVEKLGWDVLNRKISSKKASELPSCERSLVDGAATKLKSLLDGSLGNLQKVINEVASGSVVDKLGGGAAAVLIHAVDSVYDAVGDVSCGINNGAKLTESALNTGDLLGGAIDMLKDISDTVAHTASNVAEGAAAGIGDAADAVADAGETALSDADDVVHKAASTALDLGQDAATGLGDAANAVAGTVGNVASTALTIGHDAATGVHHAVNDVLGFLTSLI